MKFPPNAKIRLTYVIARETEKAINTCGEWLPKSLITVEYVPNVTIALRDLGERPVAVVTVPVWLAQKNDLCHDTYIAKALNGGDIGGQTVEEVIAKLSTDEERKAA